MINQDCHWEHFEHEADIGIRGYGDTLASAFEQTAIALTSVICDVERIKPAISIHIQCEASDPDLLLVDWLNALIYEMATRQTIFGKFQVHIKGAKLTATAWGETIDRYRHMPTVEVKGATYTELEVVKQADGTWLAQCVIDV